MIRRLQARLKDIQVISNKKYHFIMVRVYAAGVAEGARITAIMLKAEANSNKGCILGPEDAEKAVAEAERIVKAVQDA